MRWWSSHDTDVAGIKDSSGDVDLFASLLELRTDDFAVLQGTRQAEMAALLRAGSDGFVAGIENVVPGLVQSVIAAIESGDAAAEHAAVARVALAGTILTHGDWLAALKVAVAMLVGSARRRPRRSPASPTPGGARSGTSWSTLRLPGRSPVWSAAGLVGGRSDR